MDQDCISIQTFHNNKVLLRIVFHNQLSVIFLWFSMTVFPFRSPPNYRPRALNTDTADSWRARIKARQLCSSYTRCCTFIGPCVTSYLTFYQSVGPDRRKQEPWDRGGRNLRTHLPLINFSHCNLELISTFCRVCILLGYIERSVLTFPFSTILYATIRVNILEPTYNYAVPLLKIICGSWGQVCLLSKAVN